MRLSKADRERLEALAREAGVPVPPAPKRPRKYRNEPVEMDGIRFDSRKEAARWSQLRIMERAGLIADLKPHPRFPLVVEGQPIGEYVGDFSYVEKGVLVVEDTKSPATVTPLYKLKKKLVRILHGIEVREV